MSPPVDAVVVVVVVFSPPAPVVVDVVVVPLLSLLQPNAIRPTAANVAYASFRISDHPPVLPISRSAWNGRRTIRQVLHPFVGKSTRCGPSLPEGPPPESRGPGFLPRKRASRACRRRTPR